MTLLFASLLPLLLPLAPESDSLALFRQWSRSPSTELRIQAVRSLRGQTGRDSRVALCSLLADPHPAVRAAVRDELVQRPPGEALELAAALAALRDPRARLEGLRAVLERKEDPTRFARDPNPAVRRRTLASGRVPRACFVAALRDRDGRTRALALEGLGEPAPTLVRDRDEAVRIAVARVARAPGTLGRLLNDRSWRVRLAAVRRCERLRLPETVPLLIRSLGEKPGRVRARAAAALERLTRAGFGDNAARWKRWWGRQTRGYRLPDARGTPPVVPPTGPRGKPRRTPRAGYTTAQIRFRRLPVVSRRLCFVLDASRSMSKPAPGGGGKTRWELVVSDLLGVLHRLPPSARFNVILFRTKIETWRPRLVPATRAARRACEEWIEKAKPAGWTNLFDGLAAALDDDAVDTLFVLTDGVPSRGTETARRAILDECAYLNRFRLVQINCVQAGGAEGLGKRWRGFLDELAQAHDGLSVRE